VRVRFLTLISILFVLAASNASAAPQSRSSDREYDLVELSRTFASLEELTDQSDNFTCPQKCSSMDTDAVAICGSFQTVGDCLNAGCVWSCE
jgi:folylpolyglutamate synthase/dihydropteroate synthase